MVQLPLYYAEAVWLKRPGWNNCSRLGLNNCSTNGLVFRNMKEPSLFARDPRMLLPNFNAIVHEYLPKFFANILKKDGTLYPPENLDDIFLLFQIHAVNLNLGCSLVQDKELDRT